MPRLPDRPRVLLIEDAEDDAILVQGALEDAAPHARMDHQSTLEAGVRRLQTRPFDFVLVDLNLPDGRDDDVVRRVRDAAEHTPVIVVSSHFDEEANARCIEAGATDYLCKSRLTPDTLRRTLLYSWVRPRARPGFRPSDTMQIRLATTTGGRSSEDGDPLAERRPDQFRRLTRRYTELFDPYFDSIILRRPAPRNELNAIAEELAELGANPRDLMALHWAALQPLLKGLGLARQEGYSKEGRLLALEVMGYLADHYRRRAGVRRVGPG